MNTKNNPSDLPDLAKTRALYEDQRPALETALNTLQVEIRQLLERHNLSASVKFRVKALRHILTNYVSRNLILKLATKNQSAISLPCVLSVHF